MTTTRTPDATLPPVTSTPTGAAFPVERIPVDERARGWLPRAHYADAFRVAAAGSQPAERWARKMFGGDSSPRGRLFDLVVARGALGLRLGPAGSPDHIGGWTVASNDPGTTVLHMDSWMLVVRLVIEVSDAHTTLTSLLRYDRRPARRVWAVVGIGHRAMVPVVLGGAARALAREPRDRDRA